MVPEVTCDTRMKEIELKEICVDIDLQLPRSGAGDVSTYNIQSFYPGRSAARRRRSSAGSSPGRWSCRSATPPSRRCARTR